MVEHEAGHRHDEGGHGAAEDADREPTGRELMEQAVRELLIEKGVFTAADINRQIDVMDARNPELGAKVVARAWVDPAFKTLLLRDAEAAVESLGIEFPPGPRLKAIENTAEVHNVAVCTLCSCYPRMLMGVPPAWYKSREYRSRVVVDPRGVLKEFGTELPEDVEIRVHDSAADLRFLVLPRRPEGTEGMSEEALAALITRNSMIGVSEALRPGEVEERS